ncbi:RES family NAD+ phosphorylase [Rhizobium sp. Root1203]|uniref:RES family NAD+ phosphorylase n=1 Tax=Rhizobium sp. Root1203 TaxID=1736427 RepID=UPI00070D7B0C|nr:RES family NAD+ phosphorylase [Rhizobium sp. Root1203]
MGQDAVEANDESEDIELNDDELFPSLCMDCARHPSVKKLVAQDCTKGRCALCARDDVDVRNPQNLEPLVMVIRALVRFHYDEQDYNPHWGGESVMSLFYDDANLIVEPPKSNLYVDDFDEWLNWPVYPDWDKGIAMFAGHDHGDRGMNFAISRTTPPGFSELQARLLTENFFQVESGLEDYIARFINDIEAMLPQGEVWFRARVGETKTFHRFSIDSMETMRMHVPWLGKDIGAPPPPKAGFGRVNRAGVSVMYLASDPYTAVAEIRPHPGHTVSLGGFRSKEPIRLADFNPDIGLFSQSDQRLSLYAIIRAFDRLMSMPVTPDERTPYLLTQLLAEVLLRHGFDGVRFRSSVSQGSNICIFYPDKFEFVSDHSEVRQIKAVAYEIEPVHSALAKEPGDMPFD